MPLNPLTAPLILSEIFTGEQMVQQLYLTTLNAPVRCSEHEKRYKETASPDSSSLSSPVSIPSSDWYFFLAISLDWLPQTQRGRWTGEWATSGLWVASQTASHRGNTPVGPLPSSASPSLTGLYLCTIGRDNSQIILRPHRSLVTKNEKQSILFLDITSKQLRYCVLVFEQKTRKLNCQCALAYLHVQVFVAFCSSM